MRYSRRVFVKGGLACLAFLGLPVRSIAGDWPEGAFGLENGDEALIRLLGTELTETSDAIELSAPLVAENGAVVPISVATSLPDVHSISIVVKNNPRPLTAYFEIFPGTLPRIACRIKMAETSELKAVVKTGSGLFSAATRVKITLGGCA